MKLLTAPLPADRLHDLRDTLLREGVNGMTVTRLETMNSEPGGVRVKMVQIAVLLEEAELERLLDAAIHLLQGSGIPDDARLMVQDIPEAIRIRTGESGPEAIR